MSETNLLNGYLTNIMSSYNRYDERENASISLTINCTAKEANDIHQFLRDHRDPRKHGFDVQIDGVTSWIGGKLNLDVMTKCGLSVRAIDVIFNDPATIVFWSDDTKTVVKCQEGDTYNPEAGLAMCYMKKALGNSSRAFNNALKPAIEEEEASIDFSDLYDIMQKIRKGIHKEAVHDNSTSTETAK